MDKNRFDKNKPPHTIDHKGTLNTNKKGAIFYPIQLKKPSYLNRIRTEVYL